MASLPQNLSETRLAFWCPPWRRQVCLLCFWYCVEVWGNDCPQAKVHCSKYSKTYWLKKSRDVQTMPFICWAMGRKQAQRRSDIPQNLFSMTETSCPAPSATAGPPRCPTNHAKPSAWWRGRPPAASSWTAGVQQEGHQWPHCGPWD